jgi:Na+/H+ antiporter NhaA
MFIEVFFTKKLNTEWLKAALGAHNIMLKMAVLHAMALRIKLCFLGTCIP